jgi:PEGA domain-containing protein
MYRVIAIVCASLALAACDSNPDWMKAPDFSNPFKFEPVQESVRVESEPPGAEAKASNGQSCRTPCALSLPGTATTVTFTLSGYQPDSE